MRKGVLVVGSVNMDLVIRSDLPRRGETLFGSDFRALPGGKGANQAVAAARLGGKTAMIARVGGDAFAETLLANLAEEGVDTSHVGRDPEAATGVALILVQPNGENSIVLASGANMRLKPEDLERARSCFEEAAVVLLQFEIPLETVDCGLELARQCGCRAVLDAGPAVNAPPELLAKAYVVSPNETETEALIGAAVRDKSSAECAAQQLRNLGVDHVLLKLGERGALLHTEAGRHWFPAFAIEPVDTTAAGDAFTAAVGVAVAEGRDWADAAPFANAAGALTCLSPGAQPSLPKRSQVERFLQKHSSLAQGAK